MTRIIQTFTDFGNRKWRDRLDGGKADDKEPDDFDSDDLKIGTKVEREHSSNPDISTEIAMDHLAEDPDYYDKLIASGIADEEDAVNLWDELKSDSDKEKAKSDIMKFFDEEGEDYMEEDVEEDKLGTDKIDFEDDEQIFDEEEPKNKIEVMEKRNLKNYMSFLHLHESADFDPEEIVNDKPVASTGPDRKYSKENKYKFQLPYEKNIVDKLDEYNFTYYVPEDSTDPGKPTPSTHSIIIDIQNLTYSVILDEDPDIKIVDPSKLKNILENL